MTLRTSLVIDGDASGAAQATSQATAGLGQVEAAAAKAAAETQRAAQIVDRQMAKLRAQAAMQRQQVLFQLNDIGVSLASGMNPLMVAIQQGSQLATGPGGLAGALKVTGDIAVQTATKFAPLIAVVAAVGAGVAGLTYEINRSRDGIDVSFGDTALAVLQTLGDYLWDVLKPLVGDVGKWFDDVWQSITKTTADVVNWLIRKWVDFGLHIQLVVESLPDIFALGAEGIANAFLVPIKFMVDQTIGGLNSVIDVLNSMGANIAKLEAPAINIDFGESDAAGRMAARYKEFQDRIAANNATDYAGQFFSDVADHAQQNARDRQKDKKAKPNDYAREIAQIRERTAALQTETNVIGLSTFAAEKARKVLELETAARKDATGLTTQRIAEIQREATAYAQAAATLEQRKSSWQAFSSAGASALDALGDSALEAGKNIGDVVNNIIKDFARLALQMAILNPLKNALFGTNEATFGGLGGVFGSLFGVGGFGGGFGGNNPVAGTNLLNAGRFAGGGSTGNGRRAGGLDGQGGFLAMLHPQETVIDHASGQSTGGVVINISNNVGADVSARQTGTDAAGRAIIAIAVNEAQQRIESKMAKGSYRSFGVGPGTRRT